MGPFLVAKDDSLLIVRSQFFERLRETCNRHAFEYLEPVHSQNVIKNKLPFLRKHRTILDRFEGQWLVGTYFDR